MQIYINQAFDQLSLKNLIENETWFFARKPHFKKKTFEEYQLVKDAEQLQQAATFNDCTFQHKVEMNCTVLRPLHLILKCSNGFRGINTQISCHTWMTFDYLHKCHKMTFRHDESSKYDKWTNEQYWSHDFSYILVFFPVTFVLLFIVNDKTWIVFMGTSEKKTNHK